MGHTYLVGRKSPWKWMYYDSCQIKVKAFTNGFRGPWACRRVLLRVSRPTPQTHVGTKIKNRIDNGCLRLFAGPTGRECLCLSKYCFTVSLLLYVTCFSNCSHHAKFAPQPGIGGVFGLVQFGDQLVPPAFPQQCFRAAPILDLVNGEGGDTDLCSTKPRVQQWYPCKMVSHVSHLHTGRRVLALKP